MQGHVKTLDVTNDGNSMVLSADSRHWDRDRKFFISSEKELKECTVQTESGQAQGAAVLGSQESQAFIGVCRHGQSWKTVLVTALSHQLLLYY
jgi:hypothetical protein